MTFKGHSRSLKMVSHRSSYWRSIVTTALFCIISEIKRNIGGKSQFFSYPTSIRRPGSGWPRQNFAELFRSGKTRMFGLPHAEESWKYDDQLSCFDTILERVCVRQTDRQNSYISIAVLTRDNNSPVMNTWGVSFTFFCYEFLVDSRRFYASNS